MFDSNESIFHFEMAVLLAYPFIILFNLFISNKITKMLLIILYASLCIVLSQRDSDYNSDTRNYLSYYHTLSDDMGLNSLFLTKIEPPYLVTLFFSNSFNNWLFINSLVSIFIFLLFVLKVRKIETIAVVSGLSIILLSSSFRFSNAIVVTAYLFSFPVRNLYKRVVTSLITANFHIAMGLSGFFLNTTVLIKVLVSIIIMSAAFFNDDFFERAVGDPQSLGFFGLRTYVAFLIINYYILCATHTKNTVILNIIFATGLFLIINIYFHVLNRLLVLLILSCVVEFDHVTSSKKITFKTRCLFSSFMSLILIYPYLINLWLGFVQ